MALSAIHTGFGFRQNGGRENNADHSIYYAGTEVIRYTASQVGLLQDLVPNASDGVALGTTALMFADLFLASGGVLNFNNGDVTATHSANTLTFAGASSGYLFDAAVTSSNATAGIGYATGAGGTVIQQSSKSQATTLSTVCGAITMNSAALAADVTVSFTLTNTAVAATDAVIILHESAGTLGAYSFATTAGAGSVVISVHNNTPGSLSEAIVLRMLVIKSVNA